MAFVDGIKGKLLASEILAQQAASNTPAQFGNSPDLDPALLDAIIGAFDEHEAMSKMALNSEQVRAGLKELLLGPVQLYAVLRARNAARFDNT